jgi:hypothetical protein
VKAGTVATLQLSLGGRALNDLVKIVRCEDLDLSGLYHVAAEFVSATPADAESLRYVMRCTSSEAGESVTADDPR